MFRFIKEFKTKLSCLILKSKNNEKWPFPKQVLVLWPSKK
jgi:hypothetical protein